MEVYDNRSQACFRELAETEAVVSGVARQHDVTLWRRNDASSVLALGKCTTRVWKYHAQFPDLITRTITCHVVKRQTLVPTLVSSVSLVL